MKNRKSEMVFNNKIWWRWGEVSPRAEGFYKEVYIHSALFCLD